MKGLLVAVALLAAACSSGQASLSTSSGGTSSSGTTGGMVAFDPNTELVYQGTECDAAVGCGSTPNEAWVTLAETDDAGSCSNATATGAARKVRLILNNGNGNLPIAAGGYAVVPWQTTYPTTNFARVDYFETDNSIAQAPSGQVTVTQVTPALVGSLTAPLNLLDGGGFGSVSLEFGATWCGPPP